jgi:predicted ferric reductase/Ca2+-binding EF-hand superfamily protein
VRPDNEAREVPSDGAVAEGEAHPISIAAPKATAQPATPPSSALPSAAADTSRASGFRWSAPGPRPGEASSLALMEPGINLLDPRIAGVLERCFDRLCGRDSNIDALELGSGLEIRTEYLAQRVLCVLDADRDGLIDREDFLTSIRTLLCGSARERLSFAFRIHDLDDDQALDRAELQHMIALGLREDSLDTSEAEAERLTDLLLLGADRNEDGRVSFAEFEVAVHAHTSVFEQITRSGLIWIAPDEHLRAYVESCDTRSTAMRWLDRLGELSHGLRRKLENHALSLTLFAAWALLNAVLFEHAMAVYRARAEPLSIQLARGAGACLKLNAALLLVPMLRVMLTWVRRTPRLRALPVDHALTFHRVLGHAVLVFALVHTLAHLWHADPTLSSNPLLLIATMHDGPSGAALLLGMLLMWLCALPVLRKGHFELFHVSHMFYLAFFPLLLIHGTSFWAWGAIPCLAFAVDHVLRVSRHTHTTKVVSASALRSQVTRLTIARPPGFVHRPTDYLFLRIPELARHEWHPFTISSAPEREHLTMHIRSLGNWTRELHALITSGRASTVPSLQVELDGPYGAPCTHIFEARHAVLIGAGIGATPFASVLESLALGAHEGRKQGSLERVHFFWINHDQHGFEWFRELLASIERMDTGTLLDVRIYMTGGRNDAASAIVSLAREFAHETGRPDLVTGLKARTRMGHPNFMEELRAIANLHAPDPVPVFFCGPPGLAHKVRAVCLKLGLEFRQEHF